MSRLHKNLLSLLFAGLFAGLFCLALPAISQGVFPGDWQPNTRAVHLDGKTALYRTSALDGIADSPTGTLSSWFKAKAGLGPGVGYPSLLTFNTDLTGGLPDRTKKCSAFVARTPDAATSGPSGSRGWGGFLSNLADCTAFDNTFEFDGERIYGSIGRGFDDKWHHVMVSWDMSQDDRFAFHGTSGYMVGGETTLNIFSNSFDPHPHLIVGGTITVGGFARTVVTTGGDLSPTITPALGGGGVAWGTDTYWNVVEWSTTLVSTATAGSDAIMIPNKVGGIAVNNAGTDGTPGACQIFGTTGSGTLFSAFATVTGAGSLPTGPTDISGVNPGSYVDDPLGTDPVTSDCGLTDATVDLTMVDYATKSVPVGGVASVELDAGSQRFVTRITGITSGVTGDCISPGTGHCIVLADSLPSAASAGNIVRFRKGARVQQVALDGVLLKTDAVLFRQDKPESGAPFDVRLATIGTTIGAEGFSAAGTLYAPLNIDLAELYFDPVNWLDLSVAANIEKFRDAGTRRPVELGLDCGGPGGNPVICLRLRNHYLGLAPVSPPNLSPSSFADNDGSGGAYTIRGTLRRATTDPFHGPLP